MGIEAETAERRNQATTHANSSIARQNSALTAGSISAPVLGTTRRCASVLETVWRQASTTSPEARPDLSGTVSTDRIRRSRAERI